MKSLTRCLPIVISGLALARPAMAQEEPAPPIEAPPAAPEAEPVDPKTEEMRAHHRRGLELFDEGDFRLALIEFERAYAIGGSARILFNIGQVHYQLNNYAKARLALERYLAEGGDAITPKRRADVERDLAALRQRTATLSVRVNVDGAEIAINDATMGKAPLERALVDAGTLRVQITRAGYATRVTEITLAGGDQQVVTIDLTETRPDVVVTHTGLPAEAITGWIVTGVLLAGTVGTGIAAISASSTYDTKRTTPIAGSPQEAQADLSRQRNLVGALAVTTDVLAISTIVAAGVSLYFTLRGKPEARVGPRVSARPGGAVFSFGF
ncbi:MAG: PEGA domain-containing protein [Labilithrix sp.]|nr:PEGA domain-containing protein [Labilithrix sp.]